MHHQTHRVAFAVTALLLLVFPLVVTAGSGALNRPAHAATDVTPQIAVGTEHTCALQSDGSVYCWGLNH